MVRVGDHAGAEEAFREAADCGNIAAMLDVAMLREQAGDIVGAEAWLMCAADCGDIRALQ